MIWLLLSLVTKFLSGQDCNIISKANDITPDHLCSPVTADWEVTIRGVNDAGTSVQILYDWDDGTTEIFDAVNTNPDPAVREWSYTASHTYTSDDDKCNYHPTATLIVNGEICTSSSQEQIVTVWDNDNSNGGQLFIDPKVYPICFGNGADVRFQDNTQFNCVPPQEKDVPNIRTRWIQWIYGTDNTMTGTPVTINGTSHVFPYTGNVITLPGPVTGSGEYSEIINVANDKLIGQYFEVTLRYWNFCNPYDDPLIPGPPADPVNGDHDPVTTTAMILIVPYPDATIDPIDPVCLDGDTLYLSAADGGGTWSGDGIIDPVTGAFDPMEVGIGDHIVRYEITDGNNCSDWDTAVVSVMPGPDASITPVAPACTYHTPFKLNSLAGSGTWSGTGISDSIRGIFNPEIADTGIHQITFLSDPDANGCRGMDQINIEVHSPPDASFLTPDSAWCENDMENTALIGISGTEDQDYDLIWQVNGEPDTITGIANDSLEAGLQTMPGMNTYRLNKITENFNGVSCSSSIDDVLQLQIYPQPKMQLDMEPDGYCSPVGVEINAPAGNRYQYYWNFGDGAKRKDDTSFVYHTYFNEGLEDTSYSIRLTIETQHGCIDSIKKEIPVYPNPLADFFVSPREQDYPETTVNLINFSSAGNWNYLWRFGDSTSSELKEPVEHHYETYGEFDIHLKTYSEYCADSISKKVRILPPPPEAVFSPDTAGCGPLTVEFTNLSKHADTYVWDFDDGTFSRDENPVHTFYSRRQHKVTLTALGPRGKAETSQQIIVYPDPVADFKAYPKAATRLDQVFRFVNRSEGATRYRWDFGDGGIATESDPSYVYGKEGEFDVNLFVWNEYSCPDTIKRKKYVKVIKGEGDMVFPNAFRWNGSGPTGGYWTKGSIDNSVFHPHFENVVEYELAIYSRWGELLYRSFDLYKGWDGYFNDGKLAPQGVYVYKAWVKYVDGRQEVKVGDVTFLH